MDLHAISVLLSAIAIPVIVFALGSSEISARLGVLSTLRLAMALMLVGFASFIFTRADFNTALISRLVQGVGQGLFLASAITYTQSRLSPFRMLSLLGLFSVTMPLAQAVAPPFGEWVLENYGDRAMFILASIPAIVALGLTVGLRPLARSAPAGKLTLLDGWKRRFIEPLVSVFLNGLMFGFCAAYLAVDLDGRGVPLAYFFTSSAVTMFSARLLALRSLEQADPRIIVAIGLGFQALGFAIVACGGARYGVIALGGAFFGLGYSLTYPVISFWMGKTLQPDRRAGPLALLNGAFNIGQFAMPLPESWLIAAYGYNAATLTLSAFTASFALILAFRSLRALMRQA